MLPVAAAPGRAFLSVAAGTSQKAATERPLKPVGALLAHCGATGILQRLHAPSAPLDPDSSTLAMQLCASHGQQSSVTPPRPMRGLPVCSWGVCPTLELLLRKAPRDSAPAQPAPWSAEPARPCLAHLISSLQTCVYLCLCVPAGGPGLGPAVLVLCCRASSR